MFFFKLKLQFPYECFYKSKNVRHELLQVIPSPEKIFEQCSQNVGTEKFFAKNSCLFSTVPVPPPTAPFPPTFMDTLDLMESRFL